jgi:hypothetical protein
MQGAPTERVFQLIVVKRFKLAIALDPHASWW